MITKDYTVHYNKDIESKELVNTPFYKKLNEIYSDIFTLNSLATIETKDYNLRFVQNDDSNTLNYKGKSNSLEKCISNLKGNDWILKERNNK